MNEVQGTQYDEASYRAHHLVADAAQLRFAVLLFASINLFLLGSDLWVENVSSAPILTIALRLLFLLTSLWVWSRAAVPSNPSTLDRLTLFWAAVGLAVLIGDALARPTYYLGHHLYATFALLMFFAIVPLPPRYKLILALLYLLPALAILFFVKRPAQVPFFSGAALMLPLTVFSGYLVALRIENYRRAAFQASLELESMARTDPLTGVANRRAFMQWADRELARTSRIEGQELAVLILDLDHFKSINDLHGHAAGDEVLVKLCRRVEESLRRYDFLARMGGEEFVVGLPRCSISDARVAAERIRSSVAGSPFKIGQTLVPLTVSIGVASLRAGESEIDGALSRADQAMYEAKRAGRNTVCAEVSGEPNTAGPIQQS